MIEMKRPDFDNDPEVYRLAACVGKEPMDRPTATRIARKSKHAGVTTYKCKSCGHWHVGKRHMPKAIKTRKRNRVV